ncbi:hypothetical protein [Micromonospora aurantiaca (nom. illeg.)]|uniref:hypothetical protein n=1 Tax=Micromonospora aurantiaca (nom. illeg.) TaxID=47850 RepID=UPI0001BF570B|nr:hypothetical protein [Micromonospora aurantiaca]ADL47606.1 hypothetical protein Micau_4090 [Micromonospora aurantiaca ATCC 27029]
MASTSSTASAAGVPTTGRSDQVRQFSSVAQATLALGCKTYTGTIAQGGGEIPTVTPAQ